MKSQLRTVKHGDVSYQALAFVCPACIEMVGGSGLHLLAVNPNSSGARLLEARSQINKPMWNWDGNLEKPSLSPSILTHSGKDGRCHAYLRAGVMKYLDDCTHSMKGKQVPIPDLPSWFVEETNDSES